MVCVCLGDLSVHTCVGGCMDPSGKCKKMEGLSGAKEKKCPGEKKNRDCMSKSVRDRNVRGQCVCVC